jgi:hypothetical protein
MLAIKDTPGNSVDAENVAALKELGFKSFSSELWRTYIGVVNQGRVICDKLGAKEEPISFEHTDIVSDFAVRMTSQSYRAGNLAEIALNGVNYAINKRGVNIVVFDVQRNRLIDSVVFDYHNSTVDCHRQAEKAE